MEHGNGGKPSSFMLDPVKMADLGMNIINKVGLPLVLLFIVGYWLAPAHLEFLDTATMEQKKQTAIVSSLKDTAEKALSTQGQVNQHISDLTQAIGEADRKKLEQLERFGSKLDQNGQTLEVIHEKVDKIKTAVERVP